MGLFDTEKQRKQPTEYVRLDQCRGDGGKCSKPVHAKQLCKGHYTREQRGQSIDTPLGVPNGTWTDKTCSVDDCDRPVRAKHLCTGHYQRLKSGQSIDDPLKKQAARGSWVGKVCSVDGCERKAEAHGLCASHYGNRRAGRDYNKPIKKVRDWTSYYSIPKKYRVGNRESAVVYRVDFLDRQGKKVASIIGCQAGGQLGKRISMRLREPTSLEKPYIDRVLNGELKPLRVRVLHEWPWMDDETQESVSEVALRYEAYEVKKLKADPSVECLNDRETDNVNIAKIIARRKKRLQESDDPEGVEH